MTLSEEVMEGITQSFILYQVDNHRRDYSEVITNTYDMMKSPYGWVTMYYIQEQVDKMLGGGGG